MLFLLGARRIEEVARVSALDLEHLQTALDPTFSQAEFQQAFESLTAKMEISKHRHILVQPLLFTRMTQDGLRHVSHARAVVQHVCSIQRPTHTKGTRLSAYEIQGQI